MNVLVKVLIHMLFAGTLLLIGCGQTNKYVISGTVEPHIDHCSVVLSYTLDDDEIRDTAKIVDGKFNLSGQVPHPIFAVIELTLSEATTVSKEFFLENSNLEIRFDTANHTANVKGSESNVAFEALYASIVALDKKRDSIAMVYESVKNEREEAIEKGNKTLETEKDAALKQLEFIYDSLDAAKNPIYGDFVAKNPGSYVSLFALGQIYRYVIKTKEARAALESLQKDIIDSKGGQLFLKKIEFAERTDSGKVAIPFQQEDVSGKLVSLDDFKGKYLLLDFWASWCFPCRKENPNLVKLYRAYKDKGFAIVGVGLERNRQNWLDAIHKDSLGWCQISDLKFFDNTIAKEYGVWSIPQNVLISPDGTIIGKNLSAEKIDSMLQIAGLTRQ